MGRLVTYWQRKTGRECQRLAGVFTGSESLHRNFYQRTSSFLFCSLSPSVRPALALWNSVVYFNWRGWRIWCTKRICWTENSLNGELAERRTGWTKNPLNGELVESSCDGGELFGKECWQFHRHCQFDNGIHKVILGRFRCWFSRDAGR